MSNYLPSTSPVIIQTVTGVQPVLIPASQFTVLSGQMTGNPDNSISINIARLRAVMNNPLPTLKLNYHFKILGNSPTISVDSDGVTRQGVVLWANVQNACNIYFISCRTDSREASGTTVVEVQKQFNPLVIGPPTNAQLNACAGIGYSLLSQLNGTQAKIVSNINIMDGAYHDFTVNHLGPAHWTLYLDNILVLEALDPANTFPIDSDLYALRTDNVNVQLGFQTF